jgi:seryl-tRNA synthetase
MLDLKFVRSRPDVVKRMLASRRYSLDLSLFETVDKKRREILAVLENLRHRRNKVSEEIARLKKSGQDASSLIGEMKKVSLDIKDLDASLSRVDEELQPLLMIIPNVPHESVVVGRMREITRSSVRGG